MKLLLSIDIDVDDKHSDTVVNALLSHVKSCKAAYGFKADVTVEKKSWFSF